MPRSAGSKSQPVLWDTPLVLPPEATVADAARLLPATEGHGIVVADAVGRAALNIDAVLGHRPRDATRHGAARRAPGRPGARAARHRSTRTTSRARATRSTSIVAAGRRDRVRAAPRVRRRHARRAAARCARPCTARRSTRRRPPDRRRGRRHQRRRRRQGARARRGRSRRARRRHRARTPGGDAARPCAPSRNSGSASRSRRATSSPPRACTIWSRAGRDDPQGRRRPRRDVHDPHDDRRRPPAVLRRARDRRGRTDAWARTCGPTGECATPATWRSRSRRERHPS